MPAASFLLLPLTGPASADAHVGVLVLAAAARARLASLLRTLAPGDAAPLADDDLAAPARVALAMPARAIEAPDDLDAPLAQVTDGLAPALLVHAFDRALFHERLDAWGGAAESAPGRTASLARDGATVQWTIAEGDGTRWRSFALPIDWLRAALAHADAYEADRAG